MANARSTDIKPIIINSDTFDAKNGSMSLWDSEIRPELEAKDCPIKALQLVQLTREQLTLLVLSLDINESVTYIDASHVLKPEDQAEGLKDIATLLKRSWNKSIEAVILDGNYISKEVSEILFDALKARRTTLFSIKGCRFENMMACNAIAWGLAGDRLRVDDELLASLSLRSPASSPSIRAVQANHLEVPSMSLLTIDPDLPPQNETASASPAKLNSLSIRPKVYYRKGSMNGSPSTSGLYGSVSGSPSSSPSPSARGRQNSSPAAVTKGLSPHRFPSSPSPSHRRVGATDLGANSYFNNLTPAHKRSDTLPDIGGKQQTTKVRKESPKPTLRTELPAIICR